MLKQLSQYNTTGVYIEVDHDELVATFESVEDMDRWIDQHYAMYLYADFMPGAKVMGTKPGTYRCNRMIKKNEATFVYAQTYDTPQVHPSGFTYMAWAIRTP